VPIRRTRFIAESVPGVVRMSIDLSTSMTSSWSSVNTFVSVM